MHILDLALSLDACLNGITIKSNLVYQSLDAYNIF